MYNFISSEIKGDAHLHFSVKTLFLCSLHATGTIPVLEGWFKNCMNEDGISVFARIQ